MAIPNDMSRPLPRRGVNGLQRQRSTHENRGGRSIYAQQDATASLQPPSGLQLAMGPVNIPFLIKLRYVEISCSEGTLGRDQGLGHGVYRGGSAGNLVMHEWDTTLLSVNLHKETAEELNPERKGDGIKGRIIRVEKLLTYVALHGLDAVLMLQEVGAPLDKLESKGKLSFAMNTDCEGDTAVVFTMKCWKRRVK